MKTKKFYWLLNSKSQVMGLIKAKDSSEALRIINPKLNIKYACKCDFNLVPKINYLLFHSPFLYYKNKSKMK